MKACQCEHIAHFHTDKVTPNGNPGHNYGAKFSDHVIVARETPYGIFSVCNDCDNDCFANSRFDLKLT